LGQNPCKGKAPFLLPGEFTQDFLHYRFHIILN